MEHSLKLYLLFVGLLYGERLIELFISRRNIQRLLAEGAREVGQKHFRVMAVFHALFPALAIVEVMVFGRPFPGLLGYLSLAVVVLAQCLRWWAVSTLGPAWNVRVVVAPDSEPIRRGPYRLLKHPNYLAVVLEVAAVPMVHGAWLTAIIATIVNALLLTRRIPLEEKAMGARYAAAFARHSRLLPGVRRD